MAIYFIHRSSFLVNSPLLPESGNITTSGGSRMKEEKRFNVKTRGINPIKSYY